MLRVNRLLEVRWIGAAVLVAAALLGQRGVFGQETPSGENKASAPAVAAEESPAAETPGSAASSEKKPFRGRLPMYFGRVVDADQRAEIYDIQKKYAEQIASLQAQLAAIVETRDAEIHAVLSPAQREQIEQLQEEAKSKRRTPESDE